MESGNTHLVLAMALKVFSVHHTHGRLSTVQGMFQVVESAKHELRHLRSEEMFDRLFEHLAGTSGGTTEIQTASHQGEMEHQGSFN
ncbi:hypothetical protein HPB50_007067 [Hyalomma asiaticum]|uniref:Uncharacterized protein n=1 Tax=Hyalomma asiaticum TaxID=266040 RepID=A0ACB7SNT5_HYAAI|nr:hypothetical protein HPB50_007067 [Hyalomma asiaticum]